VTSPAEKRTDYPYTFYFTNLFSRLVFTLRSTIPINDSMYNHVV